jgi:hypothetical protein
MGLGVHMNIDAPLDGSFPWGARSRLVLLLYLVKGRDRTA